MSLHNTRTFALVLIALCLLVSTTLAITPYVDANVASGAPSAATIQQRADAPDAGKALAFGQIILWLCLSSLFFVPCALFLCLCLTFTVIASIEILVYIAIYAKSANKNGGLGSKKGTDFVEPLFSASPFVFAFLEFFLPGAGYWCLGQLQKGVVALIITIVFICIMCITCFIPYIGYILNVVWLVLFLITSLIAVVDVYGLACKSVQDGQPITAREAYIGFLGSNQTSGNYSNLEPRMGGQQFNPYGPYSGGYPQGAPYPPQGTYPQGGYPAPANNMPPMSAHIGQYPQPSYVPPNPAMMQKIDDVQQSTQSDTQYAKFEDK